MYECTWLARGGENECTFGLQREGLRERKERRKRRRGEKWCSQANGFLVHNTLTGFNSIGAVAVT